ncbi:uncharacterized protein LOC113852528 [Abrus precatorius]|uniref:Uncharacterized protein LOC113852528 n=1 Tax=Abrus precatorius TaxID=3816 RepID=A0A8B8K4P5_ABRPR|nr:uncharacterized protein LOC113852528 [Abrus precatorius]
MNVLDSNVEALAFNYLSFGLLTALNNLWTWVALLTAALSFWKIRSAGCPKPDEPISIGLDPVVETLTPHEATEAKHEATPQMAVGHGVPEDVDGVRKGKFTVYYEEEEMQCGCGESEGFLTALGEWEEREGSESEWWKRWERLLRLRNGENDNGWYMWQDVTELNGNVVRLWDSELRFGGLSLERESWYNNSSCIRVW